MKGLSKGRYDETFAGEDGDLVNYIVNVQCNPCPAEPSYIHF